MGPPRRLLAASCALAACVWSTYARAEDQAAFFSLVVNQVKRGDVFVVVRDDGDVLIERSALEAAGLSHFTATKVNAEGRDLVSLASVQPRVKFFADEDAVTVTVDAPSEMLPKQALDLSSTTVKPSYDSRASAFINYSPTLQLVTGGAAPSATAFVEGGISENNRLWYSSVNGSNGAPYAVRGLTNLTVDNRPRMVHTIIGDGNVSTGPIGAASVLFGLTYARDFSLDPYFVRFPSMRFASSTDVPAQVDVYVNGIRQKTLSVDPGTFTLDNLRGLQGSGVVQYVIRDAFGGTQVFSSPFYIGPSVLKKGLDDFAFSAGLPRGVTASGSTSNGSFDYELPAFLGYYRRGLTDQLTLGVRAEGQWGTVLSGGPDIAASTPVGIFELELGASEGNAGTSWRAGAAGVFSYQYLTRRWSVSASLRALTPEYTYVQLPPTADRTLYTVSTAVAVPLSLRASVSTIFSLNATRDIPLSSSVGLSGSFAISRNLSLLLSGSFGTQQLPAPEFDGIASVQWAVDSTNHGSAGVAVTANVPAANFQYAKSSRLGEDWGLSAAANLSPGSSELSVGHRVQTSANTITTNFDWQGNSGLLSVNPAGSVVWVAGSRGFFLARPIPDAFALVRVPDMKDIRINLNGQQIGRTNANGELLVPELTSFTGAPVRVSMQDLPMTYRLENDVITVAAPRRGAAFVEFRGVVSHYFRGRVIVVRGGKDVVPAYGDFAIVDRLKPENVSPLAEDGAFELEGITPGPHDAEIRHTSGVCKFRFEAKATSADATDLGVLRCTAPP